MARRGRTAGGIAGIATAGSERAPNTQDCAGCRPEAPPVAPARHAAARTTVQFVQAARLGLFLGVIALIVWPLSYAWIPNAGHNPDWVGLMVPVAEWGAIACAIGAISLGIRSRRAGVTSLAAERAPRVGWLTLGLMAIAAFLIAPALYRDA